ncbi:MAG: hypothetical protein HYV78_02305 [Candidatus Wildermuthbacteria bacterium]|nr:hypothetical protein [Candidatus Wildermuthbacteria bacterium]
MKDIDTSMSKRTVRQNIFGILGVAFLFGILFVAAIPTSVSAAVPPAGCTLQELSGDPMKGNLVTNDKLYKCNDIPIKDWQGVPISREGQTLNQDCADACTENGGIVLLYGGYYSVGTPYCLGATTSNTCIIALSVKDKSIDVKGVQADRDLPKDTCANTFCAIRNLTNNLPLLLFAGLPVAFFSTMLLLTNIIASTIAGLLGGLLKIIISATLDINVIPGKTGVPTIEAGWEFTRDLVNLLFLLFAVFIGLATILRIENYQLKKTLPKLLTAALLVNFSGVFVGIVVDFSNLLTKFFIDRIGTWGGIGGDIKNSAQGTWAAITGLFTNLTKDSSAYLQSFITPIASMMVTTIFYAFFLLAIFVVMIVFIARVAVLWILTIMAPFAFASLVIPGAKKIWDEWIKTLISWAIIGIPLGFFLYISSDLVTHLGKISSSMPVLDGGFAGVLKSILAPTTVVAILIYGLNFSIKMAPAGAQALIKWGKTAGIGLATGGLGLAGGSILASKFGQRMLERGAKTKLGSMTLQDLRAKNAATPNAWSRVLGNSALFIGSQVSGSAGWLTRKASVKAMEWSNAQNKGVDTKMGGLEKRFGKNYKNIAASYGTLGALDYQGKIATALQLAKMKGGKGLGELSQKQLREAVSLTAKYRGGDLMDIVKHMPKLRKDEKVGGIIERTLISDGAKKDKNNNYIDIDGNVQAVTLDRMERLGYDFADDKERIKAALRRKLAQELKSSDLENLDRGLGDDAEFKEDIAHWKPWEFIRKMGEEWSSDIVEKLQDEAEKLVGGDLSKLMKVNPTFVRGFLTPQGRLFMRQWNNVGPAGGGSTPLNEDALKAFVASPAASTRYTTAKPEPVDIAMKDPDMFPEIYSLFFGEKPSFKVPGVKVPDIKGKVLGMDVDIAMPRIDIIKRLKADMPSDLQTLIRKGNKLANEIKQDIKDVHAAQQNIDALRSIEKADEDAVQQHINMLRSTGKAADTAEADTLQKELNKKKDNTEADRLLAELDGKDGKGGKKQVIAKKQDTLRDMRNSMEKAFKEWKEGNEKLFNDDEAKKLVDQATARLNRVRERNDAKDT